MLATLIFLAGCQGAVVAGAAGDPRTFDSLATFRTEYWRRPLPLQGQRYDAAATGGKPLDPSSCGSCHPTQFADWGTALHSRAFSPGLEGQLVEWEANDYGTVRDCLACHAPLAEQSARLPRADGDALVANPYFDPSLQRRGVACAACHLRGGQGHGPPRRDGSIATPVAALPHGGVRRTPFFESSEFCAGCHQFEEPSANGKSLQNTYAEWADSRYGRSGTTCQICHMPDRRHLWRGIHDSAMTASGVRIALARAGGSRVVLRLTNTGTGHRFPTYVTPTVVAELEQLDGSGAPVPGGLRQATISRVVRSTNDGWAEDADTRIPPDSSFTLEARILPGTRSVRGRVTVYPDGFYHDLFAELLAETRSNASRTLLTEALQRSGASPYPLFADSLQVR